ncbi:unnamed protein product [Closterium sp. Naga37s-1]|nr:unnamed protein product [Closterium sp. Naga37s-1]
MCTWVGAHGAVHKSGELSSISHVAAVCPPLPCCHPPTLPISLKLQVVPLSLHLRRLPSPSFPSLSYFPFPTFLSLPSLPSLPFPTFPFLLSLPYLPVPPSLPCLPYLPCRACSPSLQGLFSTRKAKMSTLITSPSGPLVVSLAGSVLCLLWAFIILALRNNEQPLRVTMAICDRVDAVERKSAAAAPQE